MWPFGKRETRQELTLEDLLRDSSFTGNFADAAGATPEQALRLSAVWACIHLLANSVATLPLKAYRRDGTEFDPPLLSSPASGWTLPDWLAACMTSMLTAGNIFGLITARSGPSLKPSQVELTNPGLWAVTTSPEGRITWRFRGQERDPADIWHVRAYPYPGNVLGLSPIDYAREVIGLGLSTRRFGQAYFSDGAMPTGILKIGKPVDQLTIDVVRQNLKTATRGRRQPLIVSGDASWTQLSVPPEQSQFVDAMRLNVTEIARVFGIPASMIDGQSEDSNTYANLEGRSLHFLQYSLSPWLIRLENAISALLPRGSYVKFTTGGLLKATTKERYEAYRLGLDGGFLTIPEVRELEDKPPLAPAQLSLLEGGRQGG